MTAVQTIPRLETERLILRGWREDDYQTIATIYADEAASRFIGGQRSESDSWRLVATFIGHFHLRGFTIMAIEEIKSGACIGYCGPWRPFGWPENEVGYTLLPDHQGKGYATEAARAAIKHAYEDLGWSTAISLVNSDNVASAKVAEKLGAVKDEGTVTLHGHEADVWRYPSPEHFKTIH